MPITLTVSHVDTCLPDYLQDHHHREGELLLGICLAGQSEAEAVEALCDEFNGADWGIPDGVTTEMLAEAAKDAVKGVSFGPCDDCGNHVGKDEEGFDKACEENESQAWFLLEWSEDE